MGVVKDLTGERFGRLVAVERSGRNSANKITWLCRCDCGGTITTAGNALGEGRTASCGCLRREAAWTVKHGHTRGGRRGVPHSPEYTAWCAMIARCEQPASVSYPDYGRRGIKVCAKWRKDFRAFLADMGLRPSPLHTVDREDSNGNYDPDNCSWATREQQHRNRRSSRLITHADKTLSLAEWSRLVGLPSWLIGRRLNCGWSTERAITEPRRAQRATSAKPIGHHQGKPMTHPTRAFRSPAAIKHDALCSELDLLLRELTMTQIEKLYAIWQCDPKVMTEDRLSGVIVDCQHLIRSNTKSRATLEARRRAGEPVR